MSVLPVQDLTVNLNVCEDGNLSRYYPSRNVLNSKASSDKSSPTNHGSFNPSRDTGSALFMFLKSICSVFISPEHLVTYHQALRAN